MWVLNWTGPRCSVACDTLTQAQVSNVRFLLVDARVALERLFVPGSVHRIASLFPCPWPKERHAKHRLFTTAFLGLLNSRLVEAGEVQIVTDSQPYLQWVLEQLPDTGFCAHWTPVPAHFRTKYARKWASAGQQEFYELRLVKVAPYADPTYRGCAGAEPPCTAFRCHTFCPCGGARSALTSPVKNFSTIRCGAKVCSGSLSPKRPWNRIFGSRSPAPDHDWIIRPARGCGVIPTLGVQCALDLVRDAAQQTTP